MQSFKTLNMHSFPSENESICPHKDLYSNFHSSIFIINIHWKQGLSKGEWITNCSILQNGLLLSNKINELMVHSTTWLNLKIIKVKEVRKRRQTKNSICGIIPFTYNPRKCEVTYSVFWRWRCKGACGKFGGGTMYISLIVVMVSWVYTHAKMRQILHFKYGQLIVCRLYIKLLKTEKVCIYYIIWKLMKNIINDQMNKCPFPLIQQAQVWKLILQKQEALILKDMCSRTFITILFIG